MSSCINTLESDDTEDHVNSYTHTTSAVISEVRNACGGQTDFSSRVARDTTSRVPILPLNPFAKGKMSHSFICSLLPRRVPGWPGDTGFSRAAPTASLYHLLNDTERMEPLQLPSFLELSTFIHVDARPSLE